MIFHKAIKGQGFNVFLPLSVPSANGLLGSCITIFALLFKMPIREGFFVKNRKLKRKKRTWGGVILHILYTFLNKNYIYCLRYIKFVLINL